MPERNTEELTESLAGESDETAVSSLLLEDLTESANHPININRISETELQRLNLLNYAQIKKLLDYRRMYGPILTMQELVANEIINPQLAEKLKLYLRTGSQTDSVAIRRENKFHSILMVRAKRNFPLASGFRPSMGKPSAFAGDPYGTYVRFRTTSRRVEAGVTGEKDAGESFFRASNPMGFDFYSGFLAIKEVGWLQKAVVGDYHLRFGQGVNLWSGGGVSYGSDLTSLLKTGEGIRPYSSTHENLFFRGAAIQVGNDKRRLSLFYSGRTKDATLDSDISGNPVISSFRTDGLHRTTSELASEKDVSERMAGAYLDIRLKQARFGFSYVTNWFSLPVSRGTSFYKSLSFEGKHNENAGLDYQWVTGPFLFYGEAARSMNGHCSWLQGCIWCGDPRLSISTLYRHYDPSFVTFYSGSFAEGSSSRNEEGLYLAFEYLMAPGLRISMQSDLYQFPFATYGSMTPSIGKMVTFQADYTPHASYTLYVKVRLHLLPDKQSGTTGIPLQPDQITDKYRIHCEWKIAEGIGFRTRLEMVRFRQDEKEEWGWMAYQDLILSPVSQVRTWIRMAGFHTDGYNSRVFAYENDLLWYYAIPEFHGVGLRSYLNLKWQPSDLVSAYVKAGYTWRKGAEALGSGLDATPGPSRFDVRMELCFRF
ncbi:MAG: helix-hairpin-helix domain-containing protein [Marinilabiliales bacterium]|nr:helix-hairpin-helix domain-containing protein [Marinilabiliales bacterium]